MSTKRPCKDMTFEEFCFLLPQFEWVNCGGDIRTATGWRCPIAAVAECDSMLFTLGAARLGLSREMRGRIVSAADGCGGDDRAILREYCSV